MPYYWPQAFPVQRVLTHKIQRNPQCELASFILKCRTLNTCYEIFLFENLK